MKGHYRLGHILLALCLCLFPAMATASQTTTLQTGWLGEHEAFLVWYAKQKGWDKEEGLDIVMRRYGSGEKIVALQDKTRWAIAGCGAVPALLSERRNQYFAIAVANDESQSNAVYVRADSPVLQVRGANPQYPEVYGSAETLRGKIVLCPENTSAHYLVSKWLHIFGLNGKDVKLQNVFPEPAVNMFAKNFGDAVSLWAPSTYEADRRGFKVAASSAECGISQPILLLAEREFAVRNPEQVQAFLKVYLRVVSAIKAQGVDAFVDDYVLFGKDWVGKTWSREDAKRDLVDHPVFELNEQLAMFAPRDGAVENWLRDIAEFYAASGHLSKDRLQQVNLRDFVNANFLRGIE